MDSMAIFLILILLLPLPSQQQQQPPFSCGPSTSSSLLPFCNPKLPIRERAIDLVSRLTLDEKISQLVNTAAAIPRLDIPAYEWWNEALHGVGWVGRGIHFNGTISKATSFPQVILTAASFDSYQWYRIGQVIGKEARALYNSGQASGLTFWAPNINIFRDPRWGRGQETPGEDPFITGKYAVSYVRGVQGDTFHGDGKLKGHLQASACCKHFTAYDLENWKGVNRFIFDARVTQQDMADTYQPPFQSCVKEGRASGIMCAYNKVNGVPSCADYNLLSKTARAEWGFHGYITSDCDAVAIMHDAQGYAKQPEDAVADVLKAGMDMDCGLYLQQHSKTAVEQGKLPVSQIDRALLNLFSLRMRLGLFNGDPKEQVFGNIGPDQVCSQEHQMLALEVARNGIVLLKNSARLLPLPKSESRSLAVIGPNADAGQTLLGNYAGPPCTLITPLQGLRAYVKDTTYFQGCDNVHCLSADIKQAVKIAQGADHVILVMGLDQTIEREEVDRMDLVLPGMQQELITSIARAAKNPVVLVLLSGGPIDVSFAKYNKKIGSILWAGYPGQAGGTALAEIIFGDHNPGGRLPVTWYPQAFVKVPMTDMRMRPESSTSYPGRTYRFYKGRSVFEFGHGLSYSKYSYKLKHVSQNKLYLNQSSSMSVDKSDSVQLTLVSNLGAEFCERSEFTVRVGVENQGEMAGKHPVLLFARQGRRGDGRPRKQLVGFKSVVLSAGEKGEVEFQVSPCEHLSRANENGVMIIEQGTHFLTVGGDQHPIAVML
ncbi:Probable beta-D-xylosidase 7 [Linum grandiflorum]